MNKSDIKICEAADDEPNKWYVIPSPSKLFKVPHTEATFFQMSIVAKTEDEVFAEIQRVGYEIVDDPLYR